MNKSKSLIISMLIFLSWWVIIYTSMYLGATLNLTINGIGGEGEQFILYYYLIVLLIISIIYLIIIPLFIKGKDNKQKYLEKFKININKCSLTYVLIIIICAFIGHFIWGNLYGISSLQYIYSIQPPIVEELLFRGLILSVLSLSFSNRSSIIISSIFFGLIHIMISPVNVIGTIFIGIIYCLIVFRTKSILPTIVIHYIQGTNLYQLILGIIGICIFECINYFIKKRKKFIN